jgi:hypothetical protein
MISRRLISSGLFPTGKKIRSSFGVLDLLVIGLSLYAL